MRFMGWSGTGMSIALAFFAKLHEDRVEEKIKNVFYIGEITSNASLLDIT